MSRTREEEVKWWILMIEETEESKLAYMIVNAITAARREAVEECKKAVCPDCARGSIPSAVKYEGQPLQYGHKEFGMSCLAAPIFRSLLLPGQPAEDETKGGAK
jgi:hypothetical protein